MYNLCKEAPEDITLKEDLTFNFESESVWCMCKTCDYMN